MITATVDDAMTWGPCPHRYPRARIEKLWAGRALTLEQFLALPIPPEDIAWGSMQPYWWTDKELRQLCAAQVKARLLKFEENHPGETRPRQFLALLRDYLQDEATLNQVKTGIGIIRDAIKSGELPAKSATFFRAAVAIAWAVDDEPDDVTDPKDVARAVWANLRNFGEGFTARGDVTRIKDFLRDLRS